jgi:hypothetical protein
MCYYLDEVSNLKENSWYDFEKLSDDAKKKFLIRMKPIAQRTGRTDLVLYNKYAEHFGLSRIKPVF